MAPSSPSADEVVVEALAAAAGIAVQNADLYEQARLRERWLEASAEIRAELLSGATEQDALRLIAQRTMELTRSDPRRDRAGTGPGDGRVRGAGPVRTRTSDLLGYRTGPRHPLLSAVVEGGAMVLAELSPRHVGRFGLPGRTLRADGGGADALTGVGDRGAGGAAPGREHAVRARARCRC